MNKSEKVIKVLSRYRRVKNYVKNSIESKETDLDLYVQQLIQANRLKNQLVTEIIKS